MLTHYLPSAAVTIVALIVYLVLGANVARARPLPGGSAGGRRQGDGGGAPSSD